MLANNLRELRLKRRLSQQDVGRAVGVSASAIGMYEQGRRTPDPRVLMRLSRFFGVSADYLLTHDPAEEADVMAEIQELGRKLMASDALMFEGTPVTPDDVRQIIRAMEMSVHFVMKSGPAAEEEAAV